TITSTAAVAAAAAGGAPAIDTYVLGVGPKLANLNAIAHAGGTSQAYLVQSAGQDSLLSALDAIRTSALSCEYGLSISEGNVPNFDVARVVTRIGANGSPMRVARVDSRDACGDGPGWFYDNPVPPGDPLPTKIVLCPASCDPLVQGVGNHLDVQV